MREPVLIQDYPDIRGQIYGAKQIIFDCGNGYGLSVITVEKGGRWDHGWYLSGPGQYEAYLIDISRGSDDWDYVYEEGKPTSISIIRKGVEPFGWLSVEELGELVEVVEQGGAEAYIERKGLK